MSVLAAHTNLTPLFYEGPAAHIDFETRSDVDLKKAGLYRYVESPHTWVWGFSWRIGDAVVRQWRPGYADPVELLEHIRNGGKVVAHNAGFERLIWNRIVRKRYPHWPELKLGQQDCTMARAAAIAHPMDLDRLCNVLETKNRKDREGHALMLKMAKPRSFNADGTITWWDAPELIDRNMQYCDMDVYTETDIDNMIPVLSSKWQEVWKFDQIINERGISLDMAAVRKCASLVELAKKEADKTMRTITNRTVPKCTNVGKIIEFLNARGIETDSLRKGDQDDLIFMADLQNDFEAKQVIELRKAASKTSTAKYAAMVNCVCSDDRARALLAFHAASTGRWGGRLIQPQNFPRVDPDDEYLASKIAYLHELLSGTYTVREMYDMLDAVYGPLEPLVLLSKALRSMIVAGQGNKLVGGDFANIEGRVNAWLAGEAWKLQAFRDYDNKVGPDLYKLAYARSFGVDVESVGKGQKRQIGKVQELALGYQGGPGAFISMGDNYGVNPFELYKPVKAATSDEQWYATEAKYDTAPNKAGMPRHVWTALRVIVDNWRAAHPAIVQQWWDYQDAAIQAVASPGEVVYTANGRIGYYSDQRSLWCILPSGRMLCYSSPEVRTTIKIVDGANGPYERIQHTVFFWGTDSRTKQWTQQNLYGGLQCENVVQATSCDIMVDGMFRVEEAGFPVVLTVHDEILTEPPEWDTDATPERFAAIMSQLSPEYDGLPIAVAAWEDTRYVK